MNVKIKNLEMVATLVKERKKKMTNAEFQKKLKGMYEEHPFLNKQNPKTVNILLYILRMDDGVTDYNVNLIKDNEDGVRCIPSVKECFVPIGDLVLHVKEVECEEEDYGFDGLCLNVYVED
jgi:uncharacterized protein YihD (DUF1040 family)